MTPKPRLIFNFHKKISPFHFFTLSLFYTCVLAHLNTCIASDTKTSSCRLIFNFYKKISLFYFLLHFHIFANVYIVIDTNSSSLSSAQSPATIFNQNYCSQLDWRSILSKKRLKRNLILAWWLALKSVSHPVSLVADPLFLSKVFRISWSLADIVESMIVNRTYLFSSLPFFLFFLFCLLDWFGCWRCSVR